MSRVFSCCFMFVLLVAQSSLLQAEVVTIEATVKSVDAKKRTISVQADGKTKDLDVSSKAKVNIDGKDSGLDSLQAGQAVKLKYHDDLDVVLSIEVGKPTIAVPADAKLYGGHAYKFFSEVLTWHRAKKRCEEMGGYLVTISDAKENDFVLKLATKNMKQQKTSGVWLGGTDEAKEGDWRWVDDSPWKYKNWSRIGNQPNNAGGDEHYLFLWLEKNGEWTDQADSPKEATAFFICEWDSEPVADSQKKRIEERVGEILKYEGHTGAVWSVAFSPDGKLVASGQGVIFGPNGFKPKDYTIRLWEAETGKEVRTFYGHTETVRTLAFSPNGRQLVSGSWDKTIRVWDVESGKELQTMKGHISAVTGGITFTADGSQILSGATDKTARIWDVATGRPLKMMATSGQVNCISLSPDGKVLATQEADIDGVEGRRAIFLWNIDTGKQIKRFDGLTGVNTLTFSPDGKRLLSAGTGWLMQLWDVESGQELKRFEGHAAAFLPDGEYAIVDAKDDSVAIWNLKSGSEVQRFGNQKGIVCVAVSPDGRRAVTGGFDKTVRVWGLPY